MTDIASPIIDAMPNVEETFDIVFSGLHFRGRTVEQWEELLCVPPIPESPTPVELLKFNTRYIEINETIMKNYAYAKSAYALANATYQHVLKSKQNEIMEKMVKDNKKLGAEMLERIASFHCSKEFHAMKIHEIFVDFWKIYHDKMSLLDSRLSNLSFLVR